MIYFIISMVMLLAVSFWYGYQNGYQTRKQEEENKASARAARLRQFTARGQQENEEWQYKPLDQRFSVVKPTNGDTNEHKQKISK